MGANSDPEYSFSSNVIGTFNVLEAARAVGVKRVVFTSSREVYGTARPLPVRESHPLRPRSAYAASKAAGEIYCGLATRMGLEAVVLRLSNVYGPLDHGRVIPLLFRAALAGKPLKIYGATTLIDFVWIDVVVEALIAAGTGPLIDRPINIGSGRGVTLKELAETVLRLTGSTSPIRVHAPRPEEVSSFVGGP